VIPVVFAEDARASSAWDSGGVAVARVPS